MSDGGWDDVLSELRQGGKDVCGAAGEWLEKFVVRLMSERDLTKLYPLVAHGRLIVFIGESFEVAYDKPVIEVELGREMPASLREQYRYKISFTTGRPDGEFFRETAESVYCSFEKSLEVFDEMFAKLERVSR